MSESQSENPLPQQQDGETENKTSPTKRTPSKRVSRAQRESEELIKNMGGVLDVEGGRKTRSSTRGPAPSTPATPPPAKKTRTASTPSRRGRPKKNDSSGETEESTTPTKATDDATDEPTTPSEETKSQENSGDEKNTSVEAESKIVADDDEEITKQNQSEEKSETDSKVNSEGAETKSIAETAKGTTVSNDENEKTVKPVIEKPSPAKPVAAIPEPEPESVESPESVELMEVDSAAPTEPPTSQPSLAADDSEITKSDEMQNNETNSVSNEKEITHANNSITEKEPEKKAATIIIDETAAKLEDAKKENDVCSDPKLSATTNTSDVVAAQPCN